MKVTDFLKRSFTKNVHRIFQRFLDTIRRRSAPFNICKPRSRNQCRARGGGIGVSNNDSIFAERDAAIAERDAALNRAGMYVEQRDAARTLSLNSAHEAAKARAANRAILAELDDANRERDTWRREYDRVNALLAARNALHATPRYYVSRVTMNGPTGRSRPREYWHVRDRAAASPLRYAPDRVVASSPNQDIAAKICDRLNEDTL